MPIIRLETSPVINVCTLFCAHFTCETNLTFSNLFIHMPYITYYKQLNSVMYFANKKQNLYSWYTLIVYAKLTVRSSVLLGFTPYIFILWTYITDVQVVCTSITLVLAVH